MKLAWIFRSFSLAIILLISVSVLSCFGQEMQHDLESAKIYLKGATGNERVERYRKLLLVSFSEMSQADRLAVLDMMLDEYGEQSTDVAGRASALIFQAHWQSRRSQFDEALKTFELAQPWAEQCKETFPVIWFDFLVSRGAVYNWLGKWRAVEADATAALKFVEGRELDFQVFRPYRLLSLAAQRSNMTARAADYAGKELEYGLVTDSPLRSAAAIQRIVHLLETRTGNVTANDIRAWLERGEEYLKLESNARLEVFYALRRANLAVRMSDDDAEERVAIFIKELDEHKGLDSFRDIELAGTHASASHLFIELGDFETARKYAAIANKLGRKGHYYILSELAFADIELSTGQLDQAGERLEKLKSLVKEFTENSEEWLRLKGRFHEQKGEFEDACFYLRKTEEMASVISEEAISIQSSYLKKLSEAKQSEAESAARNESKILKEQAEMAVSNRNRIAIFSLLGLIGVVAGVRLLYVQRIRRQTEVMNEQLESKLVEQSKQLEDEVGRRHQLELESERKHRHEAIGLLATGVSHDFNNLLTVIVNAHEVLDKEKSLPPLQSQMLKLAQQASEGAAGIVHQLMSFARREPLTVEEFSVQDWLDSSTGLFASTLGEGIDFETRWEEEDVYVRLDESQLSTAVINLLSNAKDAVEDVAIKRVGMIVEHEPGKSDSESDLGKLHLIIRDNGVGIDADLLQRVAQPYVTSKEGIGTGLGLSMVANFVESSNGHLNIESDKDQGTTVTMTFPCIANQRTTKPVVPQGISFEGGTILLVEDDQLVRESTAGILRGAGFEVDVAESGDAAIEWLNANPHPRLVLSDINMPGRIDGIALRHHVIENFPDIIVVLMTGQTTQNVDPMAHVIGKPFRLQKLLAAFESAMS